jgi:hypothetical protein
VLGRVARQCRAFHQFHREEGARAGPGILNVSAWETWDLNGNRVPDDEECYANCDQSTAAPILNVLDFSCFLNQFASGATYANCDGSTTAPVLTIQDFACFLNAFAAGCS